MKYGTEGLHRCRHSTDVITHPFLHTDAIKLLHACCASWASEMPAPSLHEDSSPGDCSTVCAVPGVKVLL
jgi:hypothetical protein